MTSKKTISKKKEKTTLDFKKEMEELKKQLMEKQDKLLRSIADFQNYQKRMEKELQNTKQEIKCLYLSELIELRELLKKAVEDNNPKEGLKLMINNIESFFEKENIKTIECVGQKFDHNYHHAVTTVEKDDCEDNIIVEEVKKGYLVGDRVLRPSHVIVAKKKC